MLTRRRNVCASAARSLWPCRGPVSALPNQNSRTRRASSIYSLRFGLVRLEQHLQLRGGSTSSRDEFVVVVLHGVLRFKSGLIVLAKFPHQRFGVCVTITQWLENGCRHLEARNVS